MMCAAVLRNGKIQVREIPIPTPREGQILVRTHACGICASDLHFMEHPEQAMEQGGGLWNYDADADMVMGHEFCAEIVDYGPDALGGYGQYFLMSEAVTQEVKSDLPSELIAVSDAMAVGWYYVKKAAIGSNEVPLVIGCGAIGLDEIIMSCERDTRILSAGGCPEGDHIHSAAAHRKGLNIQFGGGPSVPDWNEALKEVCSGNIDVRPIVGETIGLDAVPDALRRSKQREAPPRIVITP
jgi:threonine dehydrogenase-like Zn-dependent dehydrogenase